MRCTLNGFNQPLASPLPMSSFIFFFVGFLVISNPVGVVPIFCELTQGRSAKSRHRIARLTATTVLIVMVCALLFGQAVLEFFGISVASFRVAGGLLILLMAISMMRGGSAEKRSGMEIDDRELSITPLAIPLTAGPGTISTAIIFSERASSWLDYAIIAASALVASLVVWIMLHMAGKIQNIMGQTGIHVVTRLMGLVLAAIAVEFIIEGLVHAVQRYA
jgi:multiple antibiotic resistance protein